MRYTPHTEENIKDMLKEINIESLDALYSQMGLKKSTINIDNGKQEYEVKDIMSSISSNNRVYKYTFLGGGYYNHYIPSVVDSITSLPGFYTAYTPYQPEASQGTLQSIFEYQTMMCNLTGMEVSNASMYDGATSVAESILMSLRINKKRKDVLISGNINPLYKLVIDTYLENIDCNLIYSDFGVEKFDDLNSSINENLACVVVQNPDFFGNISDLSDLTNKAKEMGVLSVVVTYPISLGLLKTPGEMGADIVCGDGQSLGNYLNGGGPYFGFITTKIKYVRNLPGRIVGETVDRNGKRGFVLTLQAREQHIKRQKATSNICSNQSLMALRAGIYLSTIGKNGLYSIASDNFNKSEQLKDSLKNVVKIVNVDDTFNEFVIDLQKDANDFIQYSSKRDILAGLPLSLLYNDNRVKNLLLVSVTELIDKKAIEFFVQTLKDYINE